ncbi:MULTISPECIES: M20/M25/M40 family metallo-hydrolase [Bacillus]|uniref:M20/M25/M40 family metallo-hydrolase n=1 Tax=Bacillus TaxID=1386 RepID=UPI000305A1E7|nr:MULTISPECIES: M20/M25/M40 family metallo-hydrolase [Bacillus]
MKNTLFMQSPEQLLSTLNKLVSIPSVTLSDAEKQFPFKVEQILKEIPYFKENTSHLKNHPTTDERFVLTALYKHVEAVKTVIMISHFDVVDVDDYGDLNHLAFQPIELTKALHERIDELSLEAREDLKSNEWLFGRGTMDMKCGLVQHMSLLEKAASEEWKINLLLVTVPDEEVNSAGMREVIPKLLDISKEHQLTYTLFLNSEPMFSQVPQDENFYFYTGSIGKIMPAALCFGKETHVGEPLSGINAGWMSSVLSQEIEWNMNLCESVNGVMSPPPTLLLQRDLKKDYSTKIPHRSVSLYNVLLMQRNASDVMNQMKEIAELAALKIEKFIKERYQSFHVTSSESTKVRVLLYEELRHYACRKTSEEHISNLEKSIIYDSTINDNREQTIEIVDQISMICSELGPMIVLFYSPPYYPAISSNNHSIIQELSKTIIEYTKDQFSYDLQPVEYFNGISDLSYASLQAEISEMHKYNTNLPGGPSLYTIPFEEMSEFDAPVLNVGPYGKDAHKKTERLHIPFAFEKLPRILEHLLYKHISQ